jgi:hypothetical protein
LPSGPIPSSACPPSYDQAEKLKRGENVDYDVESLTRTDNVEQPVRVQLRVGGYCEFMVFFVVCLVFGWIGYLFSCCFMVTMAASSGAAAGFGLSLIKTAVLWNVYRYDLWGQYYEYGYSIFSNGTHTVKTPPTYRETYDFDDSAVFGWLLWILAFCGFMLFVRSLIVFGRAKKAENSED